MSSSSSSLLITINVTKMQSLKDYTLFTVLNKCWSGGVVGMIGYLAVVGEQPSDPCKHGKVTLNRHHDHHDHHHQ